MIRLRRNALAVTILVCVFQLVSFAKSSRAADAVVQPALDGIFSAFETHQLVGLGEWHQFANELAFYGAVLRDPRFAAKVGNVVVEFGGSQHQGILDRYINGGDVSYSEISKVWRNTVAHDLTVEGVGYQTFFAQVREVNRSLPASQRIRVWLSEPPINWSRIKAREAWQKIYDSREQHAADFIVREIVKPGRKALVIYGFGHFVSAIWPSSWPMPAGGTKTLAELVKQAYPKALFIITPYTGAYKSAECSAAIETEMKWPKRVLISPIRGTPLESSLVPPGCMPPLEAIDPPIPQDERSRLERMSYENGAGVSGDALLYLVPAKDMMQSPADPTMWMDVDYYKELRRRYEIRHGEPLWPLSRTLPLYAAPPQPLAR